MLVNSFFISSFINFYSARAKLSICIIVFFSVAYNFVRFWEFKFDDADGIISLEDSIVPLLRGDHLFMLLYQNIATLISQFFIPLIVLCVLNLRVKFFCLFHPFEPFYL